MSAPPECPGIEYWQALLSNPLPPEEEERCERHLRSCPACQERLDRAVTGRDELLNLARQVGDPTLSPADPVLAGVLERLHEGPDSGPPAPPGTEDLYFLRPADRLGVLGYLGDYEVREVIGRGGMGVVLRAYEPALHRLVAIKVLAPALAGNATARQRFTREAQAAAAVCHDHIVAVYGVSEAETVPYLVMQYVEGESLQERLDRIGPLETEEVVRIGLQTASGLAAAHKQGLIHRDIKPANLLLEDGVARVRITDFGLARMTDDASLTQAGVVAGTPEYMAPEQARCEPVDHRADLFSLGSVLYACCTGRPPFRGSTALAVLRQLNDEAPAPVRTLNPDVPAWLEVFIARLMAKDPAERFQTAAQVAALLEGYLAHLRQPDSVPAPALAPLGGATGQGLTVSRRRSWIGPGLAVLLLVAVLALGLAVWYLAGPGAAPEVSPDGRQHLVYDFRKPIDNLPGLTLLGPDAEAVTQTDARGLRINLPADRPGCEQGVGVELASRIRGDFDINLGYEILAIGAPIPQGGAGVQMRLQLDPSSPMETVTRLRTPYGPEPAPLYGRVGHDGDIFAAFRIILLPNGVNEGGFSEGVRVRAVAPAGRLRLKRTGSRLDYLAADEGQPYCVLRSEEVGAADAQSLRVFGFTGWGPVALDARLTDLAIDAESLPDGPAAATLPARLDWSKAWPSAVLLAALLITLPLGVGLCIWRRRRAAARAPAPPAAPRPGSFPCPGCGTRLRARPDLAGKQVKCPRCAASVLVPGTEGARDDAPASPAAG